VFLIFALLCGLESNASSNSNTEKKLDLPHIHKWKSFVGAAASAPTTWLAKGTGYGDACSPRCVKTTANEWNDMKDLELYFAALTLVLPAALNAKPTFINPRPQRILAAMIARSPMLHHASELLLRASIEEINTIRGPLTAVVDFLEMIANHQATIPLILCKRTLFPHAQQLPRFLSSAPLRHAAWGTAKYETGQSIFAIIEQLAVPYRKFVEASGRLAKFKGDESEDLLAVMQRVSGLAASLRPKSLHTEHSERETEEDANRLSASAHKQLRIGAPSNEAVCQGIAKEASAWHREHGVKEVPDHLILEGFYFAGDAKALSEKNQTPGRMKKILTQVASLSTDLPEGIYVRYGEGRPDILKILIVGPDDTPYENGLFEFDMFCNHDFPKSPPKMYFRTTGGGTARLNPNLYADGRSKNAFDMLRGRGTNLA
jgi:baculoviral IAP repeat-containing protein 6